MQEFVLGVVVTIILYTAYIKTCFVPKLNKQIKVAYRKGWDACRNDCVKILTTSTCKESNKDVK